MATTGVGEGAVGLTMLMVEVTAVVWTVPQTDVVAMAVAHTAVVAQLRGWVTVVVIGAAVVVVAGVIAQEADGNRVFITELTLPTWLCVTILD